MRKGLLALITVTLLLSVCGCGAAPGEVPLSETETRASPEPETPTVFSGRALTPATVSEPPDQAAEEEDDGSAEIYRSFLSENYDKLMEASFKSLTGIGFIDLDLDGIRELILFDAGASASMGVQFFDIVDGKVTCVSANVSGIGEAFGGEYLRDVIVNANLMEDFRLLKNKLTGECFFVVESKNGSIESTFSELIRFENQDGILTLNGLFYKYEEYDTETGEVISGNFRIGSVDASIEEYTAVLDAFYLDNEDTMLECKGVFIWENSEYEENHKNFMENVDKALAMCNKKQPA